MTGVQADFINHLIVKQLQLFDDQEKNIIIQ